MAPKLSFEERSKINRKNASHSRGPVTERGAGLHP